MPGIVTAEHTYGVVVGPGPGRLARPGAWLVHRDKLRVGGSRVGQVDSLHCGRPVSSGQSDQRQLRAFRWMRAWKDGGF